MQRLPFTKDAFAFCMEQDLSNVHIHQAQWFFNKSPFRWNQCPSFFDAAAGNIKDLRCQAGTRPNRAVGQREKEGFGIQGRRNSLSDSGHLADALL
ncbi:MAG: hypothetical protein ACOYIR_03480 [Christensenellales bacterium]|jgi:hypothetical protein